MKIGDIVEEKNPAKEQEIRNKKKNTAIIVVVIISITIGIVTFSVSNSLLNKNKEPIIQDEILKLEDENVKILYDYISYGEAYNKTNKFLENKNVTLASFKNEEKFFYALQFAGPQDFEFTGEMDKDKNKIYIITDKQIKEYMKRFFGNNVTYTNNMTITHTFDFDINNMNVGTMKYNSERNGYDTVFNKNEKILERNVEPFYKQLTSAVRKEDGKIVLKEKVLYTKVIEENNENKIEIYKAPNEGILIDTKNISKDEKLDINMDNMKNTGFIEYTFALDSNNIYYFESSEYKTE